MTALSGPFTLWGSWQRVGAPLPLVPGELGSHSATCASGKRSWAWQAALLVAVECCPTLEAGGLAAGVSSWSALGPARDRQPRPQSTGTVTVAPGALEFEHRMPWNLGGWWVAGGCLLPNTSLCSGGCAPSLRLGILGGAVWGAGVGGWELLPSLPGAPRQNKPCRFGSHQPSGRHR